MNDLIINAHNGAVVNVNIYEKPEPVVLLDPTNEGNLSLSTSQQLPGTESKA